MIPPTPSAFLSKLANDANRCVPFKVNNFKLMWTNCLKILKKLNSVTVKKVAKKFQVIRSYHQYLKPLWNKLFPQLTCSICFIVITTNFDLFYIWFKHRFLNIFFCSTCFIYINNKLFLKHKKAQSNIFLLAYSK